MLSRLTTQAIRLYSQRNLATLPSSFVNRSRSNLGKIKKKKRSDQKANPDL